MAGHEIGQMPHQGAEQGYEDPVPKARKPGDEKYGGQIEYGEAEFFPGEEIHYPHKDD